MEGSPFKIKENVERILQYSETEKSLLQEGRHWGDWGGGKKKKKSIRKMTRERAVLTGVAPALALGFVVPFPMCLMFHCITHLKNDDRKCNLSSN